MRPFVLSLSAGFLALGAGWLALSVAWAQSISGGSTIPPIPYGQSYSNFEFPFYESGQLKWTLAAAQATGVRAAG